MTIHNILFTVVFFCTVVFILDIIFGVLVTLELLFMDLSVLWIRARLYIFKPIFLLDNPSLNHKHILLQPWFQVFNSQLHSNTRIKLAETVMYISSNQNQFVPFFQSWVINLWIIMGCKCILWWDLVLSLLCFKRRKPDWYSSAWRTQQLSPPPPAMVLVAVEIIRPFYRMRLQGSCRCNLCIQVRESKHAYFIPT